MPDDGYEVGVSQQLQMLCHGLARHVHVFTQRAQGLAVLAVQLVQQAPAARVGQRFENFVDVQKMTFIGGASVHPVEQRAPARLGTLAKIGAQRILRGAVQSLLHHVDDQRCRPVGFQACEERIFRARGEVILAAGAIMSPKILQLSGIGPAELLQSLGVKVVVNSPDVGARMREHLGFLMTFRLMGDQGINRRYYGAGLFKSMLQ